MPKVSEAEALWEAEFTFLMRTLVSLDLLVGELQFQTQCPQS